MHTLLASLNFYLKNVITILMDLIISLMYQLKIAEAKMRQRQEMSHSKHDQTIHRGEEMKGPVQSVPRTWRPPLWPCHPPSCPPARWPSVGWTHMACRRPRNHENLYLCSVKKCLPLQSRKVSEFWSPATLPKESLSALWGNFTVPVFHHCLQEQTSYPEPH